MILPLPPFKRNNSGRLVAAFTAAHRLTDGSVRQAWGTVFSVPVDDTEAIILGLAAMHVLLTAATNEIADSDLPSKDQFPEHSKSLRKAISASNLDGPWEGTRTNIKHEGALAVLQIFAAMLPEEDDIPIVELQSIQKAIRELFESVQQSDLPDDIKKWLLDLLKTIDLAINDYFIYGATSLRRSTSFAVGEMFRHQKQFDQKDDSARSLWMRLGDAVGKLMSLADTALKVVDKLQHVEKFLLPGPPDLPGGDAGSNSAG